MMLKLIDSLGTPVAVSTEAIDAVDTNGLTYGLARLRLRCGAVSVVQVTDGAHRFADMVNERRSAHVRPLAKPA